MPDRRRRTSHQPSEYLSAHQSGYNADSHRQHLGQGANQAFEDVDLLVALLQKHNPTATAPSTETLEAVFSELEKVRIPRSAKLVKQARAQGESRVVHGVEGCKKRNDAYREMWKDDETIIKNLGHMYEDDAEA